MRTAAEDRTAARYLLLILLIDDDDGDGDGDEIEIEIEIDTTVNAEDDDVGDDCVSSSSLLQCLLAMVCC